MKRDRWYWFSGEWWAGPAAICAGALTFLVARALASVVRALL